MEKLKNRLFESYDVNEASLSLIWQHINSDRPFANVTAFRGDRTLAENIKMNKKMANEFRKMGYGYFYVDGYWIENKGTSLEQSVKEDTLFVIGDSNDTDFIQKVSALAFNKEYQQEAVLFKTVDRKIEVHFSNGKVEKLDGFHPNRIEDFYTKLRGGSGGSYTFEGFQPTTNMGKKYLGK